MFPYIHWFITSLILLICFHFGRKQGKFPLSVPIKELNKLFSPLEKKNTKKIFAHLFLFFSNFPIQFNNFSFKRNQFFILTRAESFHLYTTLPQKMKIYDWRPSNEHAFKTFIKLSHCLCKNIFRIPNNFQFEAFTKYFTSPSLLHLPPHLFDPSNLILEHHVPTAIVKFNLLCLALGSKNYKNLWYFSDVIVIKTLLPRNCQLLHTHTHTHRQKWTFWIWEWMDLKKKIFILNIPDRSQIYDMQ